MSDESTNTLTGLTVELLSAFVANNSVRSEDLPGLINATHAALAGLNTTPQPDTPAADIASETVTGAVTARKSLGSREHIISMIDGKLYKTLKRHLSGHGLTPDQYRSRYGLPSGYPMVAPAYSEQRRETAKRVGLGRKPKEAAADAAPSPAPRKKGRKPQVAQPV